MKDFYKVVYRSLKELNIKTYQGQPEMGAGFPSIIYTIDEPIRTDTPRTLVASIVVQTKEKAQDEAEDIANNIDRLLDRNIYHTDKYYIRFLRQSRNTLGDPNPQIKRIEISYQLREIGRAHV